MKSAKCLQPLPGLITKNQIYTILYEMPTSYVIIDDRGEQCNYATTRFELVLAPQVAPDFRQMQQIADDVKITQCPVVEEYNERKTIMQEYTDSPKLDTNEILADAMAVQKQAFESSLTDLLAAANRRNKQLETELDICKWANENLSRENERLTTNIANPEAAILKERTELKEYQAKKVAQLEAIIADRTTDIQKLYDHNNELEEHVRILESEVDRLNARFFNLIEKTEDSEGT